MRLYIGWREPTGAVHMKVLDSDEGLRDLGQVIISDTRGPKHHAWVWGTNDDTGLCLSASILLDVSGRMVVALAMMMLFRDQVLSKCKGNTFLMSADEVREWCAQQTWFWEPDLKRRQIDLDSEM